MNRNSSKPADDRETFAFRLIAAVIAIPIFELSLFVGFYAATGSRRSIYLFFAIPAWLHVAYISVAVVMGLVFGFKGITWLLGHLFLTHFPKDRDEKVTVLLWLAILALAIVGFLSTGRT
jgi:hypothetical protein